ncbi:MAG: hypothetical protein ACJA2D_001763 [Pseudohongiellaceae bacterium]|jgi:hypothetical protein
MTAIYLKKSITNFSDKFEEVRMTDMHADLDGGYKDSVLGSISLSYTASKFKEATSTLPVTFS